MPWRILFFRYGWMFLGMMCLAFGIVLVAKGSTFGVDPWTVFHLGLTYKTGWTLGRISQGAGLVIIVISALLGVRPQLGTVLNMIFVGFFIDVINAHLISPDPVALPAAILLVFVGSGIIGFGGAWYLSADLGGGPRDSLMLAISKRSPWRVGNVRTAMELTVLVVGYVLGGPVGLGTVCSAVIVGQTVDIALSLFRILGEWGPFRDIIHVQVRTGKTSWLTRLGRQEEAAPCQSQIKP